LNQQEKNNKMATMPEWCAPNRPRPPGWLVEEAAEVEKGKGHQEKKRTGKTLQLLAKEKGERGIKRPCSNGNRVEKKRNQNEKLTRGLA